MGDAFASALESLFSGGDLKGIREVIGDMLIMFGSMAVQLGTVLAIKSFFTVIWPLTGGRPGLAVAGILIAAGAATIALGAAIKGSGGGAGAGAGGSGGGGAVTEPTFSFNQAQIDVQQGFVQATVNLEQSTARLNESVDKLGSIEPGVLFKSSAGSVPGGVTGILVQETVSGKNASQARALGKNLLGRR